MSAKEDLPGQIPIHLRVLLVDENRTCRMIIGKMLSKCLYHVTTCKDAETALSILRENKSSFDIVLIDVYLRKPDGFKLLELVRQEIDLPVVLLSADDSVEAVRKGITNGACDYLVKPVRINRLRNIWKHVVVHGNGNENEHNNNIVGRVENLEGQKHNNHEGRGSSSSNEGSGKKRMVEDREHDSNGSCTVIKKPRVVWSAELHSLFEKAVDLLTIEKAVPKKILELMNVPGLTREKVASHLQKHRLQLQRANHHQEQTSRQLPLQPLEPFQPAGFDGRNLLHGLPTAIEPAQPVNFGQSIGGVSMQVNPPAHDIQSNPSQMDMAPMLNEGTCSHVPVVPSYFGQPDHRNVVQGSVINQYFDPIPQNFPLNQGYGYDDIFSNLEDYTRPKDSMLTSSPGFSFNQTNGQDENASVVYNNTMLSTNETTPYMNMQNVGEHQHSLLVEGSFRVSDEGVSSVTGPPQFTRT